MKSLSQPGVAALDEVRVFLAQNYCDQVRQIPVSEALSNLLKEIEPKTNHCSALTSAAAMAIVHKK